MVNVLFFNLKIIIISVEIQVKNFIKKSRAEQIRPGLVKRMAAFDMKLQMLGIVCLIHVELNSKPFILDTM